MHSIISKLRSSRYANRVPWYEHLRRAFAPNTLIIGEKTVLWHTHLYRGFESLRGNPKYSPYNSRNEKQYFLHKGCIIDFDTAFLEDKRGIGRVGRSLMQAFHEIGIEELKEANDREKKCVTFYVFPHWCPETLPHPNCLMVPDLIPLRFPELFPKHSQEWMERLLPIVRQADHIVTISETSKQDIVDYGKISPNKITVVYCGITRLPVAETFPVVLPKNYFVYLGSYDRHKNLQVVFDALKLKGGEGLQLVLIGKHKETAPTIQKMGLEKQVTLLGYLEDSQVGRVFQGATGLVFPSIYEGFGLPPFEAALLGVPSICSRRPSMTELLDGCAIFAEPDDSKAWLEAMIKLSNDSVFRQTLAEKAVKNAESFTWEKSAKQLLEILVAGK